jgi:hypothetical protein
MELYQKIIKVSPPRVDLTILIRIIEQIKDALELNKKSKNIQQDNGNMKILGHSSKLDRELLEFNTLRIKGLILSYDLDEFIRKVNEEKRKMNTLIIIGENQEGNISLFLGVKEAYLSIEPYGKNIKDVLWLNKIEAHKKEIIKILKENSDKHFKRFHSLHFLYKIFIVLFIFMILYSFFSLFSSWIIALPMAALWTNLIMIGIRLLTVHPRKYESPDWLLPFEKYFNPYSQIIFEYVYE